MFENIYFRIVKFLDNRNVLVEFAAKPESKEKICGWYIFDFIDCSAREINFIV